MAAPHQSEEASSWWTTTTHCVHATQRRMREITQATQTRMRNAFLRVLAQGPVPRHVAFIMDGNRRFAKRSHVATIQGHVAGFSALEQILDWSMELGVQEVSVYAFSIENFKRPQEEVDGIMDLAADKFRHMMKENKMIDRLGIRVKVIGDMEMIPEKTRAAIDAVVDYSKNNTKAILNVCFAYTARDEMAKAVQTLAGNALRARKRIQCEFAEDSSCVDACACADDELRLARLVRGGLEAIVAPPSVDNGEEENTKLQRDENDSEETTKSQTTKKREKRTRRWREEGGEGREGQWGWEDEMWRAMMIKSAPDLLVRTSGEIRLSDYMLWQAAFSIVVFLNVLWPNFSVWHFLYVILLYQYNYKSMKERRKLYSDNLKNYFKSKVEPLQYEDTEETI